MNRSSESLSQSERSALSLKALQKARESLKQGDKRSARRFAAQSAALNPEEEDPWLILAAVAGPHASIAYLNQALQINPSSPRALKGMEWAVERLQAQETPPPKSTAAQTEKKPSKQPPKSSFLVLAAFIYLFLSFIAMGIAASPYYPQLASTFSNSPLNYNPIADRFQFSLLVPENAGAIPVLLVQNSRSNLIPPPILEPIPTSTPVSTAVALNPSIESPVAIETLDQTETPVPPPTETPTLVPSPTVLPTEIPTALPTETPFPTKSAVPTEVPAISSPDPSATIAPTSTAVPPPARKQKKKAAVGGSAPAAGPGFRPYGLTLNDRWIAVDLSTQTTYAMQGDTIMHTFLVSTGRWPTVTVKGVYKIYVKYRTANMTGEDYYLPDVPYVMYFYKGYGLHGTYWHTSFGTPMSHGCVNLSPHDAAWLYEFASVGTLVSVHD